MILRRQHAHKQVRPKLHDFPRKANLNLLFARKPSFYPLFHISWKEITEEKFNHLVTVQHARPYNSKLDTIS